MRSAWHFLCRIFRTKAGLCSRPDSLWLVNIQPAHQPVELPPGKVPDLRLVPRPTVSAIGSRQSFIDQDKPVRFFEDRLDPVRTPAAEKEQAAPVRVHLKLVPDNSTQTIDRLAHVGIPTDDVDVVDTRDIG